MNVYRKVASSYQERKKEKGGSRTGPGSASEAAVALSVSVIAAPVAAVPAPFITARWSAPTSASATAGAIFRLADSCRPAIEIGTIESFDRSLSNFAAGERDKSEASGPTGFAVERKMEIHDRLEVGEKLTNFDLGGLVWQIAKIQFHEEIFEGSSTFPAMVCGRRDSPERALERTLPTGSRRTGAELC